MQAPQTQYPTPKPHLEHYLDPHQEKNLLPQIVKIKIVKKEQQESVSRDAPESTSDSYKKAQAKMKQQILEAPLSNFNEKIQYTKDTSANLKGKNALKS